MDVAKRQNKVYVDMWHCQAPWRVTCQGYPQNEDEGTDAFIVLNIHDKYEDWLRVWMSPAQATKVANKILKGLKEAQPGVEVVVKIDDDE